TGLCAPRRTELGLMNDSSGLVGRPRGDAAGPDGRQSEHWLVRPNAARRVRPGHGPAPAPRRGTDGFSPSGVATTLVARPRAARRLPRHLAISIGLYAERDDGDQHRCG